MRETIRWFFRYIDSPGQIAELNFKTVKYREHPKCNTGIKHKIKFGFNRNI